ncbi:MAG TPA: HPr family phosphocarrier protein [Nitriliruptorales bacterium]|nr:HPr family phosphocarrier protein [Nitriliruptorales bacterium]
MPERTVTLRNPTGLHARPAKVFAKAAAALPAEVVTLTKDGREVNARSVLSVLTLDCHQGDQVTIRTGGEGADAALEELVGLVESGLGEGAAS